MSTLKKLCLIALATTAMSAFAESPSVLNHKVKTLDGQDVDLSTYQGKVVMIVNTASRCGLTPQYKGLQALHEQYGDKGLAVLGFPCNQFASQEPGSADEIKSFCSKGVSC